MINKYTSSNKYIKKVKWRLHRYSWNEVFFHFEECHTLPTEATEPSDLKLVPADTEFSYRMTRV